MTSNALVDIEAIFTKRLFYWESLKVQNILIKKLTGYCAAIITVQLSSLQTLYTRGLY